MCNIQVHKDHDGNMLNTKNEHISLMITYMGSLPVPVYPRMPAIDLQHDL